MSHSQSSLFVLNLLIGTKAFLVPSNLVDGIPKNTCINVGFSFSTGYIGFFSCFLNFNGCFFLHNIKELKNSYKMDAPNCILLPISHCLCIICSCLV